MPRGRAVILASVIVATVVPTGGRVGAALPGPDEEAAAAAAEEIASARERADAAAAAYFEAQSEYEVLGDQAAVLAAEAQELTAELDTLRAKASQIAVDRFMSSGDTAIPLLTSYRTPSDQLQARRAGQHRDADVG